MSQLENCHSSGRADNDQRVSKRDPRARATTLNASPRGVMTTISFALCWTMRNGFIVFNEWTERSNFVSRLQLLGKTFQQSPLRTMAVLFFPLCLNFARSGVERTKFRSGVLISLWFSNVQWSKVEKFFSLWREFDFQRTLSAELRRKRDESCSKVGEFLNVDAILNEAEPWINFYWFF